MLLKEEVPRVPTHHCRAPSTRRAGLRHGGIGTILLFVEGGRMWWLLLLLGAQTVGGSTPATPVAERCPEWVTKEFADELSDGPAKLVRLECRPFSGSPSPDGKLYYSFGNGGLKLASQDGSGPGHLFAMREPGAARSSVPFRWSSTSDFMWGSDQERTTPGGWYTGPVRLFKYHADGRREELPSPRHAAGPLDDVEWIGGDGLALAQFGSLGGYYRPERDDPDPTLAIIDAASGRVLQALSMRAILGARSAQDRPMIPQIRTIAFAEGGHPQVFLQWPTGLALHWTLGEAPVRVAPVRRDFWQRLVLDPAGRWLLIAPTLTVASIAECHDDDPCPAEPPVTGPALELFDFGTRERLWSISETTGSWGSPDQPVVSPDGRHAIMPVRALGGRACLLVAMDRGTVLQRIACERQSDTTTFATDGSSFTIAGNVAVRTFVLGRQAGVWGG